MIRKREHGSSTTTFGQLQAVEKYSGGSPVGIWKYYEENGRLLKRIDQLVESSSGSMAPDGLDHNMDCNNGLWFLLNQVH